MNKTEVIGAVAEKAALTKEEAKKAVEAFLQTVGDAVKKNEKVLFVGFGTFSVIEKKARNGVNPKTNARIRIPSRKVVRFKAGTLLAEAVK
jgi:DNA-binding protein HU-beta